MSQSLCVELKALWAGVAHDELLLLLLLSPQIELGLFANK
jgi:hypothetical protein